MNQNNGAPAAEEKGKKILIIEDDHNLQDALNLKLSAKGWQVIQAFNGQEGLQKLDAEDVSIVLLDIAMPIMNGFEMLKKLADEHKLGKYKIIIISNSIYEPLQTPETKDLIKDLPYMIKSNYTLSQIVERVKTLAEK
jgi:CheY-like chemotaxis protein